MLRDANRAIVAGRPLPHAAAVRALLAGGARAHGADLLTAAKCVFHDAAEALLRAGAKARRAKQ